MILISQEVSPLFDIFYICAGMSRPVVVSGITTRIIIKLRLAILITFISLAYIRMRPIDVDASFHRL